MNSPWLTRWLWDLVKIIISSSEWCRLLRMCGDVPEIRHSSSKFKFKSTIFMWLRWIVTIKCVSQSWDTASLNWNLNDPCTSFITYQAGEIIKCFFICCHRDSLSGRLPSWFWATSNTRPIKMQIDMKWGIGCVCASHILPTGQGGWMEDIKAETIGTTDAPCWLLRMSMENKIGPSNIKLWVFDIKGHLSFLSPSAGWRSHSVLT